MIDLLLIPYMAITARQSGGGLYADKLPKFLPELFFAAGFGYAAFQYGGWIAALLATAWSYLWMQTGHGTFYMMRGYHDHNRPDPDKPRKQTLEYVVEPVFNWLGVSKLHPSYSWACMGLKGFLIGLPVGGLPLAIMWPCAYWAGAKLKNHALSELLAGAVAGVAIYIFMAVT